MADVEPTDKETAMLKTLRVSCVLLLFALTTIRFTIDDDNKLVILFGLSGFLCAAMFASSYLQEKRRAGEQKTPMNGLGVFLLYVFLILYVILACLGSAVALEENNPLNLLPVFSYGLAAGASLMWWRAKKA